MIAWVKIGGVCCKKIFSSFGEHIFLTPNLFLLHHFDPIGSLSVHLGVKA